MLVDRERRVHSHREPRFDANPLSRADRPCRLAFAFDADRRSGGDSLLKLIVALARPRKGHAYAGKAGALQVLELASRDDAKPVDISAKKVEQWLIRVCAYGIINCKSVRHCGLKRRDLRANDIVVIDEQRRSARFRDQFLHGNPADQQLAISSGSKVGWDRSGRLHSRVPLSLS